MIKRTCSTGMHFQLEHEDFKGNAKEFFKVIFKKLKSVMQAHDQGDNVYWVGIDDLQEFMTYYNFYIRKPIKEKADYKSLGYKQQAPERKFMRRNIF